MKTAALLFAAVSLAVGGSAAFAGTKPTPPSTPSDCSTVAKMKANMPKAKFVSLNIGQMNFALGAYDAVPPRSPLPKADNAILIQMNGKSVIVWMSAECASTTPPTQISEALAADIKMIRPTAGETSDAYDSKDELHL